MSEKRSEVRWILVVWMMLISAVSFLDRVNISIAGPTLEREFQIDHVHLGWVFTAWVLGYAFLQAPSGRLADRFGPRKVLLFGTAWWAIFTGLTALTPLKTVWSLAILMAVRFLLGAGESVVYPTSNRVVAAWIPTKERGLANGFIFAGVGLGASVTPPLMTYVNSHYGWRWSFWVCALIGLGFGAVWYLIARDDPKNHPWVNAEEAAFIAEGMPSTSTSGEKESLSWRTILGSKNVWTVTASYFGFVYVAYIFFTWFFTYLLTVRGLDLKASTGYSMLPFAAMAAGSSLGGWISDRMTQRYGHRVGRCFLASGAMILAALFVWYGTNVANPRVASVVLAGGAGALYLAQSSYWAVSAHIAGRSAGAVSGVMNMGGQIGGAVTASLTPYLAKHFGWNMSFWVAAGLGAIGAIAWLQVDPKRRLTMESEG